MRKCTLKVRTFLAVKFLTNQILLMILPTYSSVYHSNKSFLRIVTNWRPQWDYSSLSISAKTTFKDEGKGLVQCIVWGLPYIEANLLLSKSGNPAKNFTEISFWNIFSTKWYFKRTNFREWEKKFYVRLKIWLGKIKLLAYIPKSLTNWTIPISNSVLIKDGATIEISNVFS